MSNIKIAYLFKSGRLQRLKRNTKEPEDFFYGYGYLKSHGLNVDIVDVTELGVSGKMGVMMTLITLPLYRITGLHFAIISRLINVYKTGGINSYDVLIVTTTSIGLAISFLKKIGFIKSKVFFIIMGTGDILKNPFRRIFVKYYLKNSTILSISKGEMKYINNLIGDGIKVEYLPFGVDTSFWCQSNNNVSDYVLSIGNDSKRDFRLLLSVWKKGYPNLIIITKQEIKSDMDNVKIIKGDWNEELLSDEKIREFIQNSKFVVVPVKQTSQPSGQSFCLQSMACGKAVIMSNIIGLWDADLIADKKNCLLYEPENKNSLENSIDALLNNSGLKDKLGVNARAIAVEKLSSNNTGKSIYSYLNQLA